jgi:hypothetical protein
MLREPEVASKVPPALSLSGRFQTRDAVDRRPQDDPHSLVSHHWSESPPPGCLARKTWVAERLRPPFSVAPFNANPGFRTLDTTPAACHWIVLGQTMVFQVLEY